MPHASYSDALKAHLAGDRITCCIIAKITRLDGQVIGLAEHVQSLVLDDVTYHATPGMVSSAFMSKSNMEVDNANISGFVTPDIIDEQDLAFGAYDGALCEFSIVNFNDLSMGAGFMGAGYLGKVATKTDGTFQVEYRSLEQMLASEVGDRTSQNCRNRGLGNGTCPVDLDGVDDDGRSITHSATVTGVVAGDWSTWTASSLATLPDGFFAKGRIEWLTGNNTGYRAEVASSASGTIQVWQDWPRPPRIGDTFRIVRGCDLRWETCKGKFRTHGAPARFNGEPLMPGEFALVVNQV